MNNESSGDGAGSFCEFVNAIVTFANVFEAEEAVRVFHNLQLQRNYTLSASLATHSQPVQQKQSRCDHHHQQQ